MNTLSFLVRRGERVANSEKISTNYQTAFCGIIVYLSAFLNFVQAPKSQTVVHIQRIQINAP